MFLHINISYHPDCGSISIFRIPCLDKAAQDVYGMKQNDQVEVELDLDIVDISSLDVVEEEISVEINLIQSWTDTRCRFEVLLRLSEYFMNCVIIRV